MRVLLVEDEPRIAEAVQQVLKRENIDADMAFDGEYGYECAVSGIYDVIVLDIMLPKMNGVEVVKSLRAKQINTPVLLLTAKSEVEDRVYGLNSGADDYLPKPFSMKELTARIYALGRRSVQFQKEDSMVCGDLTLDLTMLEIRRGDQVFKLTLKECRLLEMLIRRKGRVVSKNAIIEKIWGFDSEVEDNHVEVYISFLRKKLTAMGSKSRIKTERGLGYRIVEPVK